MPASARGAETDPVLGGMSIPDGVIMVKYNEGTLFKVYTALIKAGLHDTQARYSIDEMQNAGILFRERMFS